jgi:DNA-binding response OmpR family regulator
VKKKVLVVEDNRHFFEVVRCILATDRINQYDVIHADDGMDGIQQVVEQIPDIILLDIEMPRINGYEMLKILRSQGTAIPVIMMTANTGNWARQKALKIGCDAFMTKPFQPGELRHHIQRLLQETSSQPQVYVL